MGLEVVHGDALAEVARLRDASVDAIVTDPPYEINFMSRGWDRTGIAYSVPLWRDCRRVLKPGGYLLAFGGTRTSHRLACAIEDAGFELRDTVTWLYGNGFPKSHDVSKAIDRLDAADERLARAREFQAWLCPLLTPQQIDAATGTGMGHHFTTHPTQPAVATAGLFDLLRPLLPDVPERIEQLIQQRTVESQNFKAREVVGEHRRTGKDAGTYGAFVGDSLITDAHTDAARRWSGWGTALKPASEPIIVARKPLGSTVATCVLAHGTGALNIDACRVATEPRTTHTRGNVRGVAAHGGGWTTGDATPGASGRWPPNVVLTHAPECNGACADGCPVAELDAQSGITKSTGGKGERSGKFDDGWGGRSGDYKGQNAGGLGDSGGASRFYPTFRYQAKAPSRERPKVNGISHPTVKPLALMRWLVRLVTPPGGTVLDPFAGTGTTGEACLFEGLSAVLIENDARYLPHIALRLQRVS
jgi:site-specific DNA-methyltransferase (adenine-specific)